MVFISYKIKRYPSFIFLCCFQFPNLPDTTSESDAAHAVVVACLSDDGGSFKTEHISHLLKARLKPSIIYLFINICKKLALFAFWTCAPRTEGFKLFSVQRL